MILEIDKQKGKLSRQIVEQMRTMIVNGDLACGEGLPTVRDLSAELAVSHLTVFRAYEELKALGLVEARPRQGMRVASIEGTSAAKQILARMPRRGPMASFEPLTEGAGTRSLASAVADPMLFHADDFFAEIEGLRGGSEWNFYYPQPLGEPALIAEIASLLGRTGVPSDEASVVVTGGSMTSPAHIVKGITQPGDVILVQEPGRLFLPETLMSKQVVGVPVRAIGADLDLEYLERCVKQYRPRAMLVAPDFGHSTGLRMSLAQRKELVRVAREGGFLLIEDGSMSALEYDGSPLPTLASLDPGGVAYVGSFSYSLSPGLAIGYVRLPKELKQLLVASLQLNSGAAPKFLQIAFARFLARGCYQAHLKRALPKYRARRDAMLSAMRVHMPHGVTWTKAEGGFSSWVSLPDGLSSSALYTKALEKGVAFAPGRIFMCSGDPERRMRLSFGRLEPMAIGEAIRVLAGLMHGAKS